MAPHCHPRLAGLTVVALLLAGCGDERVTDYRAPKDAAAPAEAAAPAAPGLRWTAPAGWQAQPAEGMRLASFLVTGADGAKADLSVVSLPGDVGGELANLNRWREQVHLPPVGAGELDAAFTRLTGAAGEYLVADLLGETAAAGAGGHPARILGALLRQPGQIWFFKLAGDAALVEAQKSAFLAFLQSVQPGTAEAPALAAPRQISNTNDLPPDARGPLPAGHPPIDTVVAPAAGAGAAAEASGPLPAGHPPIDTGAGMASTPVAVAGGLDLIWTAPPEWTPKSGSAMRKGSYAITGPEGAADLGITAFPGDVGGNLANVNRWRGQLGLPPVESLEGAVEALSANGLNMLVFDGANQGSRMLGAIVPRPDETWFFKLTGPDALVARTKPAFIEFLKTIKTP